MKKILIVPLLLMSLMAFSQVKDLPIAFERKGYVLAIDPDQKMIQIDFMTVDKNLGVDEILRSQVFSISNCEITNSKKQKITINDLRSSDEVTVNGQWFQEKDEYIIHKIEVKPKQFTSELQGKVDLIKEDYAYIDGNKVRLAEGKKIKGDDKTGYKGQTYSTINEIKTGIYAKVNGKYEDNGYFLARSFTISPDVKTSSDEAVLAAGKEVYEKVRSTWSDPAKRKSLLGKTIPDLGKITANEDIQNYVNRVGNKLIPAYAKQNSTVGFVFIVIDNPELLAYVRANGLAVVYTGLLLNLENEAQLAAVLGHEITHAIYEHHAQENSSMAKKEKQKNIFATTLGLTSTGLNAVRDTKKGIADQKSTLVKSEHQKASELENKTAILETQKEIQGLLESTISNALDKDLSNFSVDQENQSDRVGLSLAALAGYDPREAPIVWKKLYGRYGKQVKNDAGTLEKQIAEFQKLQNTDNKKYDTKGLATQAALTVLSINKVDYATKTFKTHPDELKRYEALNKLIALYWNDPIFLEGTVNNEADYRKVISKLAQQNPVEKPIVKPAEKPKVAPKSKPKKKQ